MIQFRSNISSTGARLTWSRVKHIWEYWPKSGLGGSNQRCQLGLQWKPGMQEYSLGLPNAFQESEMPFRTSPFPNSHIWWQPIHTASLYSGLAYWISSSPPLHSKHRSRPCTASFDSNVTEATVFKTPNPKMPDGCVQEIQAMWNSTGDFTETLPYSARNTASEWSQPSA